MKTIKMIAIFLFLVGISGTAFANERSKCMKQCNSLTCSSNSPSVCAKEKQDCRNKCPR